jgi:hypothetical protein
VVSGHPAAFPTHEALRWVYPELSPVIIAETTRLGLLELAAKLPELGGSHYLECRLRTAGRAPVDFLVSMTAAERDLLGDTMLARCDAYPGLYPLGRLLDRWRRRDSALFTAVPVAWLEFDDIDRQQTPVASVCVCIVPSYVDPYAPLAEQGAAPPLATIEEAVEVLREAPLAAEERRGLERCFRALPAGARFIHLSVMTGRSPSELKLYGAFPQHTLLDYLQRIAWAGDLAAIAHLLDRYCPAGRTGSVAYVDLPLSSCHLPERAGLGICFSQQHLRVAEECDAAREPLLLALLEDGLSTLDEARALSRWSGSTPVGSTANWVHQRIRRWLDVKLVYSVGQPLLAKAYLGFAMDRGITEPLSPGARSTPAQEEYRTLHGAPETT